MSFWDALEDFITPGYTETFSPDVMRKRRLLAQEEEDANDQRDARRALLNTDNYAQPAGIDPRTGIDWNQARPGLTQQDQTNLLNRALPEQALTARFNQAYPDPSKRYDVKDGIIIDRSPNLPAPAAGAPKVIERAPEGPKVGDTKTYQKGDQEYTIQWDGKQWNVLGSGPKFQPEKGDKPYRIMSDAEKNAAGINDPRQFKTNGVNFEPINPGSEPPQGYRKTPTGDLEPIPGGPADIGQKGLPQTYKEAQAGLDTLEGSVKSFEEQMFGAPEKIDPATGKKIPATSGSGTELFNTGAAGNLDSTYAQILFGVKNAEQTGALDKGSVDVIEGMLKKPTGFTAAFTNDNYFKNQIASVKDYIQRRRAAMQQAYQAGNWRPPQVGQPTGAAPAANGWSAKIVSK